MNMTEKQELTFADMGVVIGGVHRPHIKLTHVTTKRAAKGTGMLANTVSLAETAPQSKTGIVS